MCRPRFKNNKARFAITNETPSQFYVTVKATVRPENGGVKIDRSAAA